MSRVVLVDAASPSILVRSRKTPAICLGLRIVDTLFPVAQGQRELIIGDRQSGKSTIWICSQVSQIVRNSVSVRRKQLVSTVAMVGVRVSGAVRALRLLSRCSARSEVCFLLAGVTATMAAQFIGHLSATAVAEFTRNRGIHHQAAYDDLTKHAIAYRQLCLFLRKPAGREAYPSDVFYLHARLLERSCNLSAAFGGGSLMSLPVIETLNNDLSAYIATNVISITDGQLYLDLTLFGVGQCPAISSEKSVSRVGAKSLDALSRSSAFALYRLTGEVRQESETAVKSDGYAVRYGRYVRFYSCLVQRSCQAKLVSTQLLLAIHTGFTDSLPVNAISILTVCISSVSSSWVLSNRTGIDINWLTSTLSVIELVGQGHVFLTSVVESVRWVSLITCTFAGILLSLVWTFASLVSHLVLIFAAATSFVVATSEEAASTHTSTGLNKLNIYC